MAALETLQLLKLLVLFVGSVSMSTAVTPITCKGGAVTSGESFSVTFEFHKDISAIRLGINVMFHPLNSTITLEGKDILQCVWPMNAETPNCIVENGYEYEDAITDHLTLTIARTSVASSGLYICHVIPQGDFQPHACKVLVTETAQIQTTDPHTIDEQTVNDDKRETPSRQDNLVAITATIIVICLVVVGSTLLWRYLKRRRIRKYRQVPANQEDVCSLMDDRSNDESSHFEVDSAVVETNFSYPAVCKSQDDEPTPFTNMNTIRLPWGLRNKGLWPMVMDNFRTRVQRKIRIKRVLNPTMQIAGSQRGALQLNGASDET